MTGRLREIFLVFVLPAAAVLVVTLLYARASGGGAQPQLCKGTYALCSAAKCIPDPADPSQAICFCEVLEGASVGFLPCEKLAKRTLAHGVVQLHSTYSPMAYEQGMKAMTCPAGTPWTDCMDAVCTVDPQNPSKAVCICPVKRTEEWVTDGGGCDTSTCETGYWSGAPKATGRQVLDFFTKASGRTIAVKTCP